MRPELKRPSQGGVWGLRAVIQRVIKSSVKVDGQLAGSIDHGLTVLLGVGVDDKPADAQYLADKIANLRIFDDDSGKMNLSLTDTGGGILSVSQFTLYGDSRKGRRPNYMEAAQPDAAQTLYEEFNCALRRKGITVATGLFGEHMVLEITNDGPVTILLDSSKLF